MNLKNILNTKCVSCAMSISRNDDLIVTVLLLPCHHYSSAVQQPSHDNARRQTEIKCDFIYIATYGARFAYSVGFKTSLAGWNR